MFSYYFYFNKFRKYKRKENDYKFNNKCNKFYKCHKHTYYYSDKIKFQKTINDDRFD